MRTAAALPFVLLALPAAAGPLDRIGIHAIGSELSLSYAQTDDSNLGTLDSYQFTNRSTFRFGDSAFGGGLNSAGARLRLSPQDVTFSTVGPVLFYQATPDVRVGVYGDFGKLSLGGGTETAFNSYGIEASYAMSGRATISGYAGHLDSKDLAGLGSTFGIRSDVALTDRLSIYGAYYHEDLGTVGTFEGGNIGGSYTLATVYGRDLDLDVTVGRFSSSGESLNSVGIGLSIPLFAQKRDMQGWQGGPHSGYANALTGD